MRRGKTTKFTKIVTVAVIGLIVLCGWSLFGLHVTEPSGAVSISTAQSFAGIALSPSAANIRIAGYTQWIQYEQYVRFEAPTVDCLKFAAVIVPGQKLEPIDEFELRMGLEPIRTGVFRDFSWFDLPKATNVVAAGGGPSLPRVWVDQDRGVFYYRKCD